MQKDGFDVLPVTNPNDIITWYNPKKETLFVVDDFCGTYTLNPIKYENWKSCVQKINTLVEKQHVKLIMSCRLQVYRDEQIKTLSLFQPCECNLLTENLRLSKSEKQSIAKFYLKEKASKIKGYYDTFDCFPLLCQLYHKNSKLNVVDFFKNPFTVYKEEIDNLQTEGAHGKYCALALCVMFNNCLKEEWLTEDVDKDIKKVIKNTYERCKVVKGTSRLVLRDELDSLSHTFIRKEGNIYRTIHDKLFDFLAFYFGSVMIQSLIKNATNRLIRERFLFEEKSTSDEFTIIVPERYQQIYIKRMVDDWSNGNIEDVFCNINMNNQIFRQRFLLHIKGLKILQQKQLASTSDTHNNSTPLLQCCFKGDIELVKWCLHHCLSNVNLCRIGGASPLFMACQEGHTDVVLLLINNKADVDICNNKVVSPLNIACQKGHTDVVKTLIHNSADINKCGESGTSPLFMACQRGLTEVVQTLINKKADINECIATGASPLFVACQQGHADVVQMLIDNKADINRCHYNEASPLYMSSQLGHTEIVQMLINKKADVNKCYETGASPLFIACQQGHTEIAQMLINNKADINKCDNEKLSPLYMACQKGHTEIVQMLIKNNPATSNNYFPIKTLLKPK
ncbi:ankyrin-1-like [Mytilus trossulus]|uniref:ankyrin-1-like n=1 Tax=Mytilus trossulus TaxID=6551 RepID=UPI003006B626